MWFLIKTVLIVWFLSILLLFINHRCIGQSGNNNHSADTLSKKEQRKEKKKKINLRPHFTIAINGVYVFLETYARFETPNNLLGVKISLEDNLGLVNSKSMVQGTFKYRITKRSGIYAAYYGLNRSTTYTLNKDIPYLDELFPQGTEVDAYFNTHVASAGYLFSILAEPDSYLGAYLNFFFIDLNTGVKSNENDINKEIQFLAPLPNIGLVMYFKLHKWLGIGAEVGAFFINADDFNGKLYNASILLNLEATKWLAFNLGYTSFNIHVCFKESDYNTTIGYNFRGPTVGAEFKF